MESVFPSSTGVNHYESMLRLILRVLNIRSFRPLQGLTIMNKNNFINALTDRIGFPSPTGVNHYEFGKE